MGEKRAPNFLTLKKYHNHRKNPGPNASFCRPWAKKAPNVLTLKKYHNQRKNPGPNAFFCLPWAKKSAQCPYFEKVPQPQEKSRAKSFFTKVIRAVAKVYSCEKNFGGYGNFNFKTKTNDKVKFPLLFSLFLFFLIKVRKLSPGIKIIPKKQKATKV